MAPDSVVATWYYGMFMGGNNDIQRACDFIDHFHKKILKISLLKFFCYLNIACYITKKEHYHCSPKKLSRLAGMIMISLVYRQLLRND